MAKYMEREPGRCLHVVVRWEDIIDNDEWSEADEADLGPAMVESEGHIAYAQGGEHPYLVLVRDWGPNDGRWAWRRRIPMGTVHDILVFDSGHVLEKLEDVAQRLRSLGED